MLNFFLNRTARQQWGIFLSALLVLLVITEAAFIWWVFRDGLLESIERSRDLARTAAAKLELTLADNRQVLEKMSALPTVRQFETKACDPSFAILNSFRFRQFERISLSSVDGRLICEPAPMSPDRKMIVREHPWFQNGLKAESFAVGHVFRGFPSMRWIIPLTHTVRDDQNRAIGLLVLQLDLQVLRERIFTIGENVEGFRGGVSDGTGRFVVHTDSELIGVTTDTAGQRIEPIGPQMFRIFGSDGIWRLVGSAPVRGTPWTVFIGVPEDFAMAGARRSAFIATMAGILVFGLFASGVLLFGRVSVARDESAQQQMGDLTRLQNFLWDNIPEGVAFFDGGGVIIEANQQLTAMLGRPREEFIGRKLNDFAITPNDQSRAALLEKGYARWTTEFSRPDGTNINIESTIRRFSAGTINAYLGVFRDFTDLKRAEEDLRKSEELLEQTGRVAGVGGWELDLITMTPRWTNQTRRLHEVPADCQPVLGTAIEYYAPEARSIISKAVDAAINQGVPYDLEVPFITAKGRKLWVRTQGKPIFEKGKVIRLIGSIQDITDRRLAEQELEEQRAKAEIASKAKSTFLAIMSHELRTPLTGILGMADLLLTENLNPEHKPLVERLAKSGKVLLDLINDVLDFSKIEANKLSIDRVPFVPVEIFDSVRELMEPLAREKSIALNFVVATELSASMLGDPKRLRQVLMNLIGNALKFTAQGRIAVSAAFELGHSQDTIMRVQVADTGAGISAQDQANLFKPYVQGDQRAVGRAGGTGLGLAISRLLVEAMGGEIAVSTQPGQGSTFTFTVALQRDRTGTPTPSVTTPHEPRARGGLRILAAEDNETSRYLITSMLQRKGHRVTAVENGALAVEAAEAAEFDVILMDMQMPVMNGMDATRKIRSSSQLNKSIPILALTADLIDESRGKYFEAGVDAIVGKPIDWAVLDGEIEKQLAAHGSKTQATATAETDEGVIHAAERRRSDDQAMLDRAALQGLADFIGADKLNELLLSFRDNLLKYQIDLSRHVTDGDLGQAKRTAHAMKGLAVQFGAVKLGKLSGEIENKLDSIAEIRARLPGLDAAIEATLAELGDPPRIALAVNA